jgi:hypothetical protein
MITLEGFGPAFGLPDPSPFVTKVEMLLKMAGLPYAVDTTGFNKAPKGKLPYIVDDGEIVAGPSSVGISRPSTISISTADSQPSSAPLPGRSRRCLRSIFIGRLSMRAGWTMPISKGGHATSSIRYPHRSVLS